MRYSPTVIRKLAEGARDQRQVSGLTHCFYRYPARFSPQFAAAAIECFSKPGDLILDPYMGGGTTVVEALVRGRRVIGNDLNSLAAFVAKVKITPLKRHEIRAIRRWADAVVPSLSYRTSRQQLTHVFDVGKMKNLTLPRARFISKVLACGLASIEHLPTAGSRDFAKCAMLRASQWALDGRKFHTTLGVFRARLAEDVHSMLKSLAEFADAMPRNRNEWPESIITNVDAASLSSDPAFSSARERVQLVITSPPYPGVHVLYHRWQVDGRRETPAPYWITGCNDGQTTSFYNFGDRRDKACHNYFSASSRTLRAIREVMEVGAVIVQMLAFNKPNIQLPRYLANMSNAGFAELILAGSRVWREVPNRRWHACSKGRTNSASEVVLVHEAV